LADPRLSMSNPRLKLPLDLALLVRVDPCERDLLKMIPYKGDPVRGVAVRLVDTRRVRSSQTFLETSLSLSSATEYRSANGTSSSLYSKPWASWS
jgi:hypothetical protein